MEDDGFDSFDDDDDLDELILLTAKPAVDKSQLNVESQLQSAQGENAILRSKLELLERDKNQSLQKLKDQYSNELSDRLSKLQQYQELIVKLEDEKKFLKSELTSMSTKLKPNKRRKLHDDTEDDVTMTTDDTTPPRVAPVPTVIPVYHPPPIIPNEKQLFIEAIYNHVINGAQDTTMNYLNKLKSPIHFKHENFTVLENDNIESSILNYLIQLNNNIRLDNLISEFIEILTIYIQKLYLANSNLATPFLLSLLHCSLNYRPSALNNDIIEQLLQFNSDFLKNYIHILKPNNTTDHDIIKKNLQYIVLDQFIIIFALDIIELLSKLSYNSKLMTKLMTKEIIKSALSITSCVNCVYNVVEILTYSLDSIDDDSFVRDDDILLAMIKLLIDGMPLSEGFRVYGLNRIIGNNDDLTILAKLVSSDEAVTMPLPILKEDITPITIRNKLKHELQTLNIKLQILKFFQIFLMNNSILSLKFEFIIELLKILIWVLLKEQEFTWRNPRFELIELRLLLISSIIKLIHFIILQNGEISQDLILQKLSNDDSINFIIGLTRISFSSDSQISHTFLQKISKNFQVPIFHHTLEKNNYYRNNISIHNKDINDKKKLIYQSNNGLEIKFDNDIIEMSRDLIELYTTAIELDNLYFAMNKLNENNEIDELMIEMLNQDKNYR